MHQPFFPTPYPISPLISSYIKIPINTFLSPIIFEQSQEEATHTEAKEKMSAAATASATFTPLVASTTQRSTKRKASKVRYTYITGLNSFGGLKAQNTSVSSLGLPVSAEQSFAKIVSSLRSDGNGGGGLSAQCNAIAEIFKIAAIMNGLTLVGVAVGFVLLRIEAFVEEAE